MRRSLKIIGIVLATLLLLSGSVVGLLHLKGVQTYLAGKVADRLSEMLEVDASIGSMHYRPLSQLTIDSVYLSDQERDTLAFIDQLQVKFYPLALRHQRINIEQLRLENPYINLQSRTDSTLNIQFLLERFGKKDAHFPYRLNIDTLSLVQTRVRYNEVLVDQVNLEMGLPVLSMDSLDIELQHLHLRAQLDRLAASFEANLHGNLDSIFAEDMQLIFREEKLFKGNVAVYHPTLPDSMYVCANCEDVYINDELLQDLLSQLQMQPIELPAVVKNLGHVHYRGDFVGEFERLELHGALTSALGAVAVNGRLHADTTLQNIEFCGHISTNRFQLGQLVGSKEIGSVAFHTHVDCKLEDMQFAYCNADAQIKSIKLRGYTYKNIQLDAEIYPEEVNGSLVIEDENIRLNIAGLADWSATDTRIDLTAQVGNLRPHTLHWTNDYPALALDATAYVSLYTSGKKEEMLDNLTGYVIVDTLQITNGDAYTSMDQFKLSVESDKDKGKNYHQLRVQSDYLTANLSGDFKYQTLPATIQNLLHQYLPALVEKPKGKGKEANRLDFYAYFRNLEELSEVFGWEKSFPSHPTLKGYIHEDINQVAVQAYIPSMQSAKSSLEDITLSLDNQNEGLNAAAYFLTHLPQDNPTAARLGDIKMTITMGAQDDELRMNIALGNTDSVRNEGNIEVISKVSKYLGKPLFDINVLPTNIVLNDSVWNIDETEIRFAVADKSMDIPHFGLHTDYQSITAHGKASDSASDSISVALNHINLDYLLTYTDASEVISIMGPVTGYAHLYSVFDGLMLEAKASIPNGGLNGVYLGDVQAEARLDRENKQIIINGEIIDSTQHKVAVVEGRVIPATQWWGLDILCDSIDISFINFWTKDLIANPQGRGYGRVQVGGRLQEVYVTGAALAKDAQVTLPQIGVTFYMTDSIVLDSTSIRFPHIVVRDQYGNKGSFTGQVNHQYFQNFNFDLRAQANSMLVMDIPETQQSFFYGKVYGSGDVHIHGNDYECMIDVNARAEAKTKFYLNINSASQATSSNFINFVQADTASHYLLRLLEPVKKQKIHTQRESKLKLSLQGEVTPQAEIYIKVGADSRIKGKGEGSLKLVYETPSENIQMQGTYTLQSGQFDFSLGNIVRRNFTIREGSQITWNSDPLAPTIDITGYYHTTASLRDLFGSESSQIATNRTSVPVNCVLKMTDELFNPVLNFAIELPQSDESVQSQINSIINTDEMLMRQVIYLLVFNRFYTPDYLQNTQNVGLNETYSLLSSTITGQINSWLSKLTDVFTMGFTFRTDGEGETASQEYEANFQIHPVNQLVINGNFGYRYNDLSNRPFFGDLDIEYLLTPNGKFRAKAFTHTVDKYSLRQANTVQGVGLVFKHDFNWKKKDAQTAQKDKKSKTRKKR